MESELKIWLDYSPKGGEPEPTNKDLDDLFSALRQTIPGDRVQLSQYRYIGIVNCSPTELASAQRVARSLRIPVGHKLEERLSRAELQRAALDPARGRAIRFDGDGDANTTQVNLTFLRQYPIASSALHGHQGLVSDGVYSHP